MPMADRAGNSAEKQGQTRPDAEDADAVLWLRSLCEHGSRVPTGCLGPGGPGPPRGFDADKFRRGQRVAASNLFSLAYAELLSMLMMFAFEDQTDVLLATGQSDTPAKAYFRYLSTMRRVRSWYEGDLFDPRSEAARNLQVVRGLHDRAAREHGVQGHGWDVLDSERAAKPALNQRAMALTQVAFIGLFVLEPAKFGAHLVTDEDLEALLHVWWVLGRALGIRDCFNACGHCQGVPDTSATSLTLRAARTRYRVVVGTSMLPRMARAAASWKLMSTALCDGAALATPGLSFPLALASLADVLEAVVAVAPHHGHAATAVERLTSLRDRGWRSLYSLVLNNAMKYPLGRAFHNALFRLSLWVSQQAEHLLRPGAGSRERYRKSRTSSGRGRDHSHVTNSTCFPECEFAFKANDVNLVTPLQ